MQVWRDGQNVYTDRPVTQADLDFILEILDQLQFKDA